MGRPQLTTAVTGRIQCVAQGLHGMQQARWLRAVLVMLEIQSQVSSCLLV